ncbi:endoglucanase 12-like protein [Tanacetum coccineum]
MDYNRPTQIITSGADLAGEMTAASVVFKDDTAYSKKLLEGAATVWAFAQDPGKRSRYSKNDLFIEHSYNSTGYFDEYLWGGFPRQAKAFTDDPSKRVLSWDNKFPAVMLLLTRLRLFRGPGYPYEEMLMKYHNATLVTLLQYQMHNWTRGGLIDLNEEMNYILGENPMNMSYVVGHGKKYSTRVHHRGASIPNNDIKFSCKGGFQWMSSSEPNPNTIMGAMVGGLFDIFLDERSNSSYTEPTLVGNAGLVAALVSLMPTAGYGIGEKSIMSAIPQF